MQVLLITIMLQDCIYEINKGAAAAGLSVLPNQGVKDDFWPGIYLRLPQRQPAAEPRGWMKLPIRRRWLVCTSIFTEPDEDMWAAVMPCDSSDPEDIQYEVTVICIEPIDGLRFVIAPACDPPCP